MLKADSVKNKVNSPLPPGMMQVDITIPSHEVMIQQPPLAKGSFGVVYRAVWKGQPVAVKQMISSDVGGNTKELLREATIMFHMGLKSPYIMPLLGICLESSHYSLVMKFMPQGSLRRLLETQKELSRATCYQIALDISSGLRDLHAADILHRDLKSYNVLLTRKLRAKLTDFGSAKPQDLIGSQSSGAFPGTLRWTAPELLQTESAKFTMAADVYSLGLIFYELVTHQLPFADAKPLLLLEEIQKGILPTLSEDCPLPFKSLIKACCDLRPEKRLTAAEVSRQLESLLAASQEQKSESTTEKKWSVPQELQYDPPVLTRAPLTGVPGGQQQKVVMALSPAEEKKAYGQLRHYVTAQLADHLNGLAFYLPPTVMTRLPEGMSIADLMMQLNATETSPSEHKKITDKKEDKEEKKSTSGLPPCADITAVLDQFLGEEESLLLLLGEPGAGKSLSTWQLICRMMEAGPQEPDLIRESWLPVPIELNQYTHLELEGLIDRALRAAGLSQAAIQHFKQPLSQPGRLLPKVLLVLDGYDEVRSDTDSDHEQADLFKVIGGEAWPMGRLKVLITCRRNFLGSLAQEQLIFGVGHYQRYKRYELLPFTLKQIESYIEMRSSRQVGGGLLKPAEYSRLLQANETLRHLVQNPFVLHLFLESLPGLSQTGSQPTLQELVRFDLYAAFFDQWIQREVRRIQPQERVMLGRKNNTVLVQDFKRMAIYLAYQLLMTNSLWVRVEALSSHSPAAIVWTNTLQHIAAEAKAEYQQLTEHTQRSTVSLFGLENKTGMPDQQTIMSQAHRRAEYLIRVLPVRRSGSDYQFVHKSLYEYLLAEGLLALADAQTPLARAVLAALNRRPIQTEPQSLYFIRELLPKSAWEKTLENVIQTGHRFIERSKQEKGIAQASANAMTLLNALRVSFAYADLRGIRIPGADLSQGLLDHADLRGAELTGVNLQDAFLSHTRLAGAEAKGLYLQEEVMSEWKLRESQMLKSPDGQWWVFYGSKNHPAPAYLYSVVEKRMVMPEGIGKNITCAAFSQDGLGLALCGNNIYQSPAFILKYVNTAWRLVTPPEGLWGKDKLEHKKAIVNVRFSPDSRWLLLVPDGGQYQIVDCQQEDWKKTIIPVYSEIFYKRRNPIFSPDSQWLLFSHSDYSGHRLDVWAYINQNWQAVTPEKGLKYSERFQSAQFSANSRWLVVQDYSYANLPDTLFSCREGKLQPTTVSADGKPLTRMQLIPNGQHLCFWDDQHFIYLAHCADEKLTLEMKQNTEWEVILENSRAEERRSSNGQWLAILHDGVALISLKDNHLVSLPSSMKNAWADTVQFSADNQWLIFYYKYENVPAYLLTYRQQQWELVATLSSKQQAIREVHFSADGRWLVGYTELQYIQEGCIIFDLQLHKEHVFVTLLDPPAHQVLFLPDTHHWLLASGSRCYVGKVGQAGLQCLIELPSRIQQLHNLSTSGEHIAVQTEGSITVIKDWRRLLTPSQQGLLTRQEKKEAGETLSVLASPSARWLMTSSRDVLLWCFKRTLEYVACLSGRSVRAVHPRSQALWIAVEAGLFILTAERLIDHTPKNWEPVWNKQFNNMVFSRDGQWLILGTQHLKNLLCLFQCIEESKPSVKLTSTEDYDYTEKWKFSPDQRRLVVASREHVHILACVDPSPQWKTLTRENKPQDSSNLNIEFSANNRWFVVSDDKNPIEIGDLQQLSWVTPKEAKRAIERTQFSANGCWLLVWNIRVIYLMNYQAEKAQWVTVAEYEYKDIRIPLIDRDRVQFSADSRWLVLSGYICPYYVLDCREDKPRWVTSKTGVGKDLTITFSTNSQVLGLCGYGEGSAVLALDGPEPHWVATNKTMDGEIRKLICSPDGCWMAVLLHDDCVFFGYQGNQWVLLEKVKASFYDGICSSNSRWLLGYGENDIFVFAAGPEKIHCVKILAIKAIKAVKAVFSRCDRYLLLYEKTAHILMEDKGQWTRVTPETGIGQDIHDIQFSSDQRYVRLFDYHALHNYVFWLTHHHVIGLAHSLENELLFYRGAAVFHDKTGCVLLLDRPALSLAPELPALSQLQLNPYVVYVYPKKMTEDKSGQTGWHLVYFTERLPSRSLTRTEQAIQDPLLIASLHTANGDIDKLTISQQEQLLALVPDYDRIFVRYLLADTVIRDVEIFNRDYIAVLCGDGSLRLWDLHDPRRPALCAATSMSFYAQSVDVTNAKELSDFNRQLLTKSSTEFTDKTYQIENGRMVEEKKVEMKASAEERLEIKTSPLSLTIHPIENNSETIEIKAPAKTTPLIENKTETLEIKTKTVIPTSELLDAFQEKLKNLCEDSGYIFDLKRPGSRQLSIQFTAQDEVLAGVEEIKAELIALVKLLQQVLVSLSIKTNQFQIKPNWKDWSLKITAEPAILDKIAELLEQVGFQYYTSPTQVHAALFYQRTGPSLPLNAELDEKAPIVQCRLQ